MRYCQLAPRPFFMPATPSRDPRIHHHPLAARTVVIAPKRADRPSDLDTAGETAGPCPFCVGQEAQTPPDVLRTPADAVLPWQARIIPNRYPVVECGAGFSLRNRPHWQAEARPTYEPQRQAEARPTCEPHWQAEARPTSGTAEPVFHPRPAHGVHEVVIESAAHFRSILEVDAAAWRDVWQLVRQRLAMLDGVPGIAWATVFKNSGPQAGASLEHLHSQLIGLDFVPPVMEAKLVAIREPGHSFASVIEQAEATGCVVAEAGDVVALIPPAPRQPLETWILPREPEPFFSATSPKRAAAVADLTRHVVARIDAAVPGADYNWWLHQAPFGALAEQVASRWHWHLEILPRLAPLAGFELGTGCHITTLAPEESARRMK
jgi:UDPglucose--hexose-1-phosphate uridylyltransferase